MSFNGRTSVSKTDNEGSTPSIPAITKVHTQYASLHYAIGDTFHSCKSERSTVQLNCELRLIKIFKESDSKASQEEAVCSTN